MNKYLYSIEYMSTMSLDDHKVYRIHPSHINKNLIDYTTEEIQVLDKIKFFKWAREFGYIDFNPLSSNKNEAWILKDVAPFQIAWERWELKENK